MAGHLSPAIYCAQAVNDVTEHGHCMALTMDPFREPVMVVVTATIRLARADWLFGSATGGDGQHQRSHYRRVARHRDGPAGGQLGRLPAAAHPGRSARAGTAAGASQPARPAAQPPAGHAAAG